MIAITINYNPITWESEIRFNDEQVKSNLSNFIAENKEKDIVLWIDAFVKKVLEETNDEAFQLEIDKCFSIDKKIIESKLKNNDKVDLSIISIDAEEEYKKVDIAIDAILSEDGTFFQDAIDARKENMETLKSTIIEIPVIATMSSGKSTVLNALIGQDLLPSLNQATTATTCRIIVNNDLQSFRGRVMKDGEIIIEEDNIDKSFVKEHNERANEEDLDIIIEGPVPQLDTNGFEIHFIDTPGPNNSQSEKHTESTYEYLEDNQDLPIILYVLNATQLKVEDDKNLLKKVSEIFENNKENLDRIIFLVNKIDNFDLQQENVISCIDKVKKYLEENIIRSEKIFPICAEYARLAQLDSEKKTRKEKSDFRTFRENFLDFDEDYKGYELVEHSPLREEQKEYLFAQAEKDETTKDLVYSGLSAIQLYIDEYIKSHHKKNVYKELGKIVREISEASSAHIELEKKNLYEKTEVEKKRIEEEKEAKTKKIEKDKESLEKKIHELKVDKKRFQKEKERLDARANELNVEASRKNNILPIEAKKLQEKFNKAISETHISVESAINSAGKDIFLNHLNQLKSLTKEILIEDKDNQSIEEVSFNAMLNNNIGSISGISLSKYTTKRVETKTRVVKKRVKNEKGFFGKLFSWDWDEYKVKEVQETYNEYYQEVSMSEFYAKEIRPVLDQIDKSINEAEKYLDTEIENLNKNYLQKIDDVIQQGFDEIYTEFQQDIVRSQEEIEKIKQELDKRIEKINHIKNTL
ncbi:dynamin family protein [Bergeyella porcorum]|uniref:dynamin family protein n=1 Tax=Bergeyella porcorum TaxID=1735111 RepID=UPI0035E6F75F